MAVFLNKDKTEMILTCGCTGGYGCGEAARIKIDDSDSEYDYYAIMTYMHNKYTSERCGCWKVFVLKLKKIWKIIRNKDHYYSDIVMNKDEFQQFKEYINQF